MKRVKPPRSPAGEKVEAISPRVPPRGGFSLLELMVAVTLLTIAILLLGEILSVTTRSWSQGQRRADILGETRGAVEFMRKELAGAFISRPAQLAPIAVGESLSDEQREFFEGRMFMPFEVNRLSGESDWNQSASFVNAEPDFGSLAFVQSAPMSRHVHSLVDRASDDLISKGLGGDEDADHRTYDIDTISLAAAALSGYYIAYTNNSPFPESAKSMKLYRHFRRSGSAAASGQGRSRGFILDLSDQINERYDEVPGREVEERALVRRGIFENAKLPFLFGAYIEDSAAFERGDGEVSQPWPVNVLMAGNRPDLEVSPTPFPPPDVTDPELWRKVGDVSNGYVFADEPMARNVVRFECEAFRWLEKDGEPILAGAEEINSYLGLNGGDEWPILVAPDFVDITISVISDEVAAKFELKGDWLFDWADNNNFGWDWRRKLVESDMYTFQVRAHVRRTF